MALRFAACLLTVVFSIVVYAADDDSQSPAAVVEHSAPAGSQAADPASTPIHSRGSKRRSGGAVIGNRNAVRSTAAPDRPFTNKVDTVFRDDVDALQRLGEREFPFSPRMVHQSNYDTRIADEASQTDGFLFEPDMWPKGNVFVRPMDRVFIVQASGSSDSGNPVLADCEGAGACVRRVLLDDRPIDVLLAEEYDDCEATVTAHDPEPAPDLPPGPVPSPAELLLAPVLGRTGLVLTGAPPLLGELLLAGAAKAGSDAPAIASQASDPLPRGTERPRASLTSGTSPASSTDACSQAEPPLKAKVEHLLEAARHLAGAGYEEEAKLFRVEAEAIQNASTRLLMEKRQELERLQQEIAELEALTGQYQMIQINCRIMELSLPENCEAGAHLEALEQPGIHVLTGHPCTNKAETPSRLLTGEELARALHAMEQHSCGTLKTLAEPVIVTMNGRPATLRSGGEFPILIPVSGTAGDSRPQAAIEWKDFGVKMQAVPFIQGNGKVRLGLETEIADRDFTNAVSVHGMVVPGLNTRRCRTDVETQFGETVAIALNEAPNGNGRRSFLVLVTARQIAPPDPRPE